MISRFILWFVICTLLFSCKKDNASQLISQRKDREKKELVFEKISTNWNFSIADMQPQTQALTANWPAWRLLVNELKQKPKSSIEAFQKKAKTLAKLADSVQKTIPNNLQKPAIRARITVMQTQCRNLELYVNLQSIPADKVLSIITEINLSISSFQLQLDEIVRKSQIPTERGEPDLIKIMDTTRAIPDKQPPSGYMGN